MASFLAMKLSFILLLTMFSAMKIQARDSQFFNKVSSTVVSNQEQPAATTNTGVAPNKEQPQDNNQQQEPSFLPENANAYGLYGHESGQLPPSATTSTVTTTKTAEPTNGVAEEPLYKHLPKNYNPVSYVTEPENIDDTSSIPEDTYTNNEINNNNNNHENNYYNEAQNYYNNQEQKEYQTGQPEYRSYTSNTFTANNGHSSNNFNYNGGSSFNSGPQELLDTSFDGQHEDSFYNVDEENNSFRPQGMSDTRSLENGKYFYDVNNERYGENHPYESLKGARSRNEYNSRNYYGNNYQNNQYEFPNEQNLP